MEKKDRQLENFKIYLKEQEKSKNTVDKYVGDARRFLRFAGLERHTGRTVKCDQYFFDISSSSFPDLNYDLIV